MLRTHHIRIMVLVLIVGLKLPAAAAPVTITAKLDSTHLLMGNVTALHLEIVQDKGFIGTMPHEQDRTLTEGVEVAGRPKADTTDLGNNRIQINRDIIIQSFDSGMYVIGPLPFVVNRDTFRTKPLALKVIPVQVDTTANIVDYKPVETVPYKWYDWLPDIIANYPWLWLALLLLLAAAWVYYHYFFKKGVPVTFRPKRRRLPPYEEAMANLQQLKHRQLWQQGQEKEYFTALIDILRVYIDRRFGINAVEMTSSEIVATLHRNEQTRSGSEQMKLILEMADVVKFAAQKPLADDSQQAYTRAVNFVEQTKPAPDEQDAANSETTGMEGRRS